MIGREFANSKALLTPFNNIWEHSTEWYIYKVSQHGILQIVYEHLLRSQFSVSSFFFSNTFQQNHEAESRHLPVEAVYTEGIQTERSPDRHC